jgi:hypothetical protein
VLGAAVGALLARQHSAEDPPPENPPPENPPPENPSPQDPPPGGQGQASDT